MSSASDYMTQLKDTIHSTLNEQEQQSVGASLSNQDQAKLQKHFLHAFNQANSSDAGCVKLKRSPCVSAPDCQWIPRVGCLTNNQAEYVSEQVNALGAEGAASLLAQLHGETKQSNDDLFLNEWLAMDGTDRSTLTTCQRNKTKKACGDGCEWVPKLKCLPSAAAAYVKSQQKNQTTRAKKRDQQDSMEQEEEYSDGEETKISKFEASALDALKAKWREGRPAAKEDPVPAPESQPGRVGVDASHASHAGSKRRSTAMAKRPKSASLRQGCARCAQGKWREGRAGCEGGPCAGPRRGPCQPRASGGGRKPRKPRREQEEEYSDGEETKISKFEASALDALKAKWREGRPVAKEDPVPAPEEPARASGGGRKPRKSKGSKPPPPGMSAEHVPTSPPPEDVDSWDDDVTFVEDLEEVYRVHRPGWGTKTARDPAEIEELFADKKT